MPTWLTDAEFAVLTAACDRTVPATADGPGAVAAGVPDYIDGLLGAFTVDPPRIWARGPTSGRFGGESAPAAFHPLSPLDELAWRTRIEGSQGRPEREFNGPVVGLQERYRSALDTLGAGLRLGRARGAGRPAGGRRRVRRAPVPPLLRGALRGPRVRGEPGRRGLGRHRLRRRGPTPRLDGRRGDRAVTLDAVIVGSGPGGSAAAEVLTAAGWTVAIVEKGRNHLLDPDVASRLMSDSATKPTIRKCFRQIRDDLLRARSNRAGRCQATPCFSFHSHQAHQADRFRQHDAADASTCRELANDVESNTVTQGNSVPGIGRASRSSPAVPRAA